MSRGQQRRDGKTEQYPSDSSVLLLRSLPKHQMPDEREARTLTLALPARCEHAGSATEKWLLSLWHASFKDRWALYLPVAPLALEFVVADDLVSYQIHLRGLVLAQLTRSVLNGFLPGIELEVTDDTIFATRPSHGAFSELRLRYPGWIEFAKDVEPDGAAAIIEALSNVHAPASAIVQILLNPTWMTTEDGRRPAFWTCGRIAVDSADVHDARRQANVLAASFGQFTAFNGIRSRPAQPMTKTAAEAIANRRWSRALLPSASLATPAQVAQLIRPPAEPAAHPRLLVATCVKTPTSASKVGIPIGEGRNASGERTAVKLRPHDLLRHALILGPSGTGKTTFLAHLARSLIDDGHGVTVIDPHGALAHDLARTLPTARAADASFVSFADTEFPIAINPLHVKRGQEFVAADELVELVERVYGREYWGPLLDLALRHAAMAAIELGGSLLESARLLDDSWYRERALARIDNPETVRVLSQFAGPTTDRRLMPAINRLQRLLGIPWLRNIVGQQGHGLDFGDLFESRAITLFDLSGIGATNARLLGSILLLLIRQATLGRRTAPGSSPLHFVLVDEASWFLSRTVGELFDQARKFGIGFVLATQRVGQLNPDAVREAILSNAGTLLTFRVNEHDEAAYLAKRLASERIGVRDLMHLPRHEAYLQLLQEGERLDPVWMRSPAPPVESANGAAFEEILCEHARRRYARPRAVVEAEIALRSHIDDVEPEVRALDPSSAFLAHAS